MEYLDKLARDAGDRADLQRELAGGYLKLGDVLGRPFNPNLGDTTGALANYRKSAAIYEELGAAASPDADAATRAGHRLSPAERGALVHRRHGRRALVRQQGPGAADRRRQRRDAAGRRAARAGSQLHPRRRSALEHRRHHRRAGAAAAGTGHDGGGGGHGAGRYREPPPARDRVPEAGQLAGQPELSQRRRARPSGLEQLEKSTEVLERANRLYPNNAMFQKNLAVINSNAADILLGAEAQRRGAGAAAAGARRVRRPRRGRPQQRRGQERPRHQRLQDCRDAGRARASSPRPSATTSARWRSTRR